MLYFDCNASFGRPPAGIWAPCLTPEALLREMDWAGVDRALVYHTLMREHSPAVGNQVLAESIAPFERLVGTWAILPPQTGELLEGDAFFKAMRAANIRALWAFPRRHRDLLSHTTFSGFLQELSARRIPLFLPRDAGGPEPADTWRLVYTLLEQYPDLTLVLAAHGPWGEDRFFRPLLERYPRFFLDLSRYELDQGLPELVAQYGPSHLLYGSNFPYTSMGGPRLALARAPIDEESRRAIAGENLMRLLEEVQL